MGAAVAVRAVAVVVGLAVTPSWPLVIYRFGGQDRARPAEAGVAGVEFVQLDWTDLDPEAGGEAEELDLSAASIRALKRDPSVNIAPTSEQRGGVFVDPFVNGMVWDGDRGTVWVAANYECAKISGFSGSCTDDFGSPGTANIKLGGLYTLDRIRVVSGLNDASRTARALRVFVAPKSPYSQPYRTPVLSPWLVEVRDNREQIRDIPIPDRGEVGFVQVTVGEHTDPWEVHEIEIYARGYVKRSTYLSNVLDFGRPMAWGELRWSGSKGERAKVLIQTRSGEDDDPRRYFRYTGRGQEKAEVSRAGYGGLRVGERAGTDYDQEHWSFWSTYPFADSLGTPVVSPSPRRYLQVKVELLPQEEDGGEVEYLELRASPPVATALVGEVWPVEAAAGEVTRFTYLLRPTLAAGDAGFDRLEIRTLSLLGPLQGLRIGEVEVPHEIEVAEPHRLVLGFPRLEARDSGTLVELVFEAQVLRYGVSFEGRVWDSRQVLEVPQGVNAGDATGEYEGNRVSVATSVTQRALLQVQVGSGVLTPNGDGVNEEARVGYEIFEITGEASVQVAVWDLAGRRLRVLHEGSQGIGRYERLWDGRDEAGRPVPPGVYLCHVSAQTDQDRVGQTRLLHLAR